MILDEKECWTVETVAVFSAMDRLLGKGVISSEDFAQKYDAFSQEQQTVACSFRDEKSAVVRQSTQGEGGRCFTPRCDDTVIPCLAVYTVMESQREHGLLTGEQFHQVYDGFSHAQKEAIRLFLEKERLILSCVMEDSATKQYSAHDEEKIIEEMVGAIGVPSTQCVDIAAGDGVTGSNTCRLFEKGWGGLAVECDREHFACLTRNYKGFRSAYLSNCCVTPENVVFLLKAHQIPQQFGVLSLDIDGYDFFVLDAILHGFRPSVVCAEINEKIPPPIKFSVLYDEAYSWEQNHFFGQSLSQLYLLCTKYDYDLVWLEYNNAFLIPREQNIYRALSPEKAYHDGYVSRADRKEKFPANADMEDILILPPEEAVRFLNDRFSKYKGKYLCGL